MASGRRKQTGAGSSSNNTRLIVVAVVLGLVLTAVIVFFSVRLSGDDGDAIEAPPPAAGDGMRTLVPAEVGMAQYPDGWEITTTSGAAEMELAEHLSEIGAEMHGAWWCPHCYAQKQVFGKEAFAVLKREGVYVECADSAGQVPTEECGSGVMGFPTWIVDGQMVGGVLQTEQLAQATGYTGSTDFLYLAGS